MPPEIQIPRPLLVSFSKGDFRPTAADAQRFAEKVAVSLAPPQPRTVTLWLRPFGEARRACRNGCGYWRGIFEIARARCGPKRHAWNCRATFRAPLTGDAVNQVAAPFTPRLF